ncbi:DegV family protein [Liquorilactobacillus oeni]|nr:DegV family protein [Liquorilactobacillus oeni]
MLRIVTDSTAQLSREEIIANNITVIPLQLEVDGKTGLDGKDISRREFSESLADSTEIPRTSQPAIGQFLNVYNTLGKYNDPILSIHITKTLSGTVETARMAAKQTRAQVTVLDSGFTDRALGFVLLKAVELGRNTDDVEKVVAELKKIDKKIKLYCFINNIDYLVKNGRASRATGFIASAIRLKLLVTLEEGNFKVKGKSHGQKRFDLKVAKIVKNIIEDKSIKQVGLSYVDGEEAVFKIREEIKRRRPDISIFCNLTSPIIMAHVGHNGFAIIYV